MESSPRSTPSCHRMRALPGHGFIMVQAKWEFPKIRGTSNILGGPYNTDYSSLGPILGSPIQGNYQVGFSKGCQSSGGAAPFIVMGSQGVKPTPVFLSRRLRGKTLKCHSLDGALLWLPSCAIVRAALLRPFVVCFAAPFCGCISALAALLHPFVACVLLQQIARQRLLSMADQA